MDTTTILPNIQHNHHLSTTTTTINNPTMKLTKTSKPSETLSSKLKSIRKKRNAGKKDRQSKIHTAQGLRDRRMRLSVHTARKFFDLNDMLGFDKASKTIEWLFSKSHEAIEEVTETLQSQAATAAKTGSPFSACEAESVIQIAAAAQKDESLNLQGDQTEDNRSRKPQDPSVDFHQSQLGFQENQKESCYPLEFSNTYHILKHLHLDNTVKTTDHTYNLGNITSITEPPSCWLNSRNPFLGFLGSWNSENPKFVPNMDSSLNGNMSSNFINFQSENRGQ